MKNRKKLKVLPLNLYEYRRLFNFYLAAISQTQGKERKMWENRLALFEKKYFRFKDLETYEVKPAPLSLLEQPKWNWIRKFWSELSFRFITSVVP